MKKCFIICMIICICVYTLSFATYAVSTSDAKEPIDTSIDCSLTLKYKHDKTLFSGLNIDLYCVATVSSDFQYTLTDSFSKTKLNLNGISSDSEWDSIRTTIGSYVDADSINPIDTACTNAFGEVSFEGLLPGMYFVKPVRIEDNGYYYFFDSAIIAVPDLDADGQWIYAVTAEPKPDIEYPSGKEITYKLLKLWRDGVDESKRPMNIKVDLFCNSDFVETVILNEENNWSYSWKATDNGDLWQVIEKHVPDGYVMTVEHHTTTFTIVNTIPDVPDIPPTGDSSDLNIYVILMLASGFLLILFSAVSKRRSEK